MRVNKDTRDAIEVGVASLIGLMTLLVAVIIMCECVRYDNSPDKTCRAADNFRKIPCDFYRG